jgi:hypothetical protein
LEWQRYPVEGFGFLTLLLISAQGLFAYLRGEWHPTFGLRQGNVLPCGLWLAPGLRGLLQF